MKSNLVVPSKSLKNKTYSWQGIIDPKPWEYPISIAIIHNETPESIPGILKAWRKQSLRPYIYIICVGSSDDLGEYRAEDCEVHYVKSHAWRDKEECYTTAVNIAKALCKTKALVVVHADAHPDNKKTLRTIAKHLLIKKNLAIDCGNGNIAYNLSIPIGSTIKLKHEIEME